MFKTIVINVLLLGVLLFLVDLALVILMMRQSPTGLDLADKIVRKLYWGRVNFIQFDPDCAVYNKDLFYTLRPGKCVFHNPGFSTEVSVNSAGIRDDEASLDAPEIIVIGDSMAMGWGVEDKQTFPELIEAETGRKTLNAAISSYGTAREVRMLNSLDRSAIRIVVVQYADNDTWENTQYLNDGNKLTIRPESAYDDEVRPAHGNGYVPFGYLWSVATVMLDRFAPQETAPDLQSPERMSYGDQFVRVLLDADVPAGTALVVTDLSLDGRGPGFDDEVESSRFMADLKAKFGGGVTVLRSRQFLDGSDYFFPDGHINPSGHSKVAAKVVEILSKTP